MSRHTNTALGFLGRLNWRVILILTSALIFLHFLLNPERFQKVPVKISTAESTGANDLAQPEHTTPAGSDPPAPYQFDDQKSQTEDVALEEVAHPGSFTGAVPDDGLPQDEYVAICMSVKNQPLDLPEFFIHHHHHIGINRIYIMDDGSEPPLSSMPDYGVPSTILTFDYQDPESFGGNHYRQLAIYGRCIEKYGSLHTWMAFIDGDEFLETPGKETLKEVLMSFEHNDTVGALGVNWRMHTSGGLLKRPESARKSFTTCHWDNMENNNEHSDNVHIKSIVKTSKFSGAINPHKMALLDEAQTVGENGDVIDTIAFRSPITRNRVGLHHYALKSREEYEAKIQRGNAMDDPKGDEFWNKMEYEFPHENCTEMAAYDP